MLIADIIAAVEAFAPLPIQEQWDNSGVQVGATDVECTGVTVCVDCTPAVIDAAIAAGNNLVISHHPLIFKPLKRITGRTPAEVVILNAIASGVTVYSSHTALDSAAGGISHRMARMLGLENVTVLDPRRSDTLKLTVYVPHDSADMVRLALFDAGAGHIGNYDSCSYSVEGAGTFRALDGANPAVGGMYELHSEPETRIEVVLPRWRRSAVERALREVHPYEEPAYEFVEVSTGSCPHGLGVVGVLPRPVTPRELAMKAKEVFGCTAVRLPESQLRPDAAEIRRVALCGGAGGSLIGAALGAGAQALVTADLRYHDYVDYGDTLALVDIGHFEGEKCACEILREVITEKFPNFAVSISTIEHNPAVYL